MLGRLNRGDRERGQIVILFAMLLVVILVSTAIVVDIGMLRNDRQRLVNALDAGALAGGALMPIDGAILGSGAAARQTVIDTVLANYPGLAAPTVVFRCLIGVDPSTNLALISRDVPWACDPHFSLGHAPVQADFTGAGDTRSSSCDPIFFQDKCNIVLVSGVATTSYVFGPAVGVMSGSTGVTQTAACKGPCGASPIVPLDLVIIIDRTGSMNAADVANTKAAAKAVLSVYDPNYQRVGLGLTGPSSTQTTCGAPAAYGNLFVAGNPLRAAGGIMRYTGVNVATPINVWSSNFGASSATVTGAGITTTVAQTALIGFYGTDTGTTFTAPGGATPTMTERFDVRNTNSNGPSTEAATGTLAALGPVANKSATAASAAPWVAQLIALSPQGAAAPVYGTSASAANVSGGAATVAINKPASTVSGDFLIADVAFDGGTGTTITAPAGWTLIARTNNAANVGIATYYHVAGAVEPASYSWSLPIETYGSAIPANLSNWIPVGLTGADAGTPAPVFNEQYTINGVPNTASHIVSAINCFNSGGNTNLATPMAMATYELQTYGRPGVKWGIMIETDGEPNTGPNGSNDPNACLSSYNEALNAKNAGIEVYTVGFGLTNSNACPDGAGSPFQGRTASYLMASMATQPSPDNTCIPAENTDGDHYFCEPKTSDLTAVFTTIAHEYISKGAHLIALYPPPIIASVSPNSGPQIGGNLVTVSGRYFTGATQVLFGGNAGTIQPGGTDTTITVIAPAGPASSTVDVRVTTPGGTSGFVTVDHYTFGP